MVDKLIQISARIPKPKGTALFSVPAGAVADTWAGRLRITEPNGCRYLLKGVTIATGPESSTISVGTRPYNPSTALI